MWILNKLTGATLGLFAVTNNSNSSNALDEIRVVEFPRYVALINHCTTDDLHHTLTLQRSPDGKKETIKLPNIYHKAKSDETQQDKTTTALEDPPKNPSGMSVLSLVDPSISKKWGSGMSLSINANSINYSTPTGGQFSFISGLNKVKVLKLSGMQAARVTPGKVITNLKEGDEWEIADDFIWIVKDLAQRRYEDIQDNLYFYIQGLMQADAELMNYGYSDSLVMDMVRVSQNPSWAPNQVVLFPQSPFEPSVTGAVQKDFAEIVNYLVAVALNRPFTPVSADNGFANGLAFQQMSMFPRQSIRDYVSSITEVNAVAVPLFLADQCTPLLRNILAATMAKLVETESEWMTNILFAAECAYTYNWAIKIVEINDYYGMYRASMFLVSIFNMNVYPDYFGCQQEAKENLTLATCLYLLMSRMSPYWLWVWRVTPEVDKECPLLPIVRTLIDPDGRSDYNTLKKVITENFDDAIKMLPNVMRRIRSNCAVSDLQAFAWEHLGSKVFLLDATLLPEKSQFIAEADCPASGLSIFRFCADMANGAQNKASSEGLTKFMRETAPGTRLELARELAYRYMLNPEDTTVNNILDWMPPYYSAYVADNLDSVKFPHKIVRRGDNQFNDKPCSDQLGWLLAWMSADWPSNRPLRIKCYQNYGEDYYLLGEKPANILDFNGHTSLVFTTPFKGLNPSNLESLTKAGNNCFAIQSGADSTCTFYISPGMFNRFLFYVQDGVCKLVGRSDRNSWIGSFPGAPGSVLLVVNETPDIDHYEEWINAALVGLPYPDRLQYALSGFLKSNSDFLVWIS